MTDVDTFLEHYGVKGMKWGVRKKHESSGGSSSSKPAKTKVTSADIHQARYRQSLRARKYQESQGDFIVARTAKGQDAAEKIMRAREKEYFTNPDAKLAARSTTGEKVAAAIVYGAVGLTIASTILLRR